MPQTSTSRQPLVLDLVVDATSAVPPYQQVVDHVVGLVEQGAVDAGTKLPPVRALAEQLGLAANTVAKAYRLLESDGGWVETRGRNGTVIRAAAVTSVGAVERAAGELVRAARDAGVSLDATQALLSAAWRTAAPAATDA